MEVLPTRIFTREDPCTKVHIYNCFTNERGNFVAVPVVQTRGWIGLNAPKYLKREGYLEEIADGNVDYYRLTPEGAEWLVKGLARHLELHPEDAPAIIKPFKSNGAPNRNKELPGAVSAVKRVARKRS